MDIIINKPLAFTEIGRKDNQEDRIFPPVAALNTGVKCFVLCDGMGGHENGEVAAEIVSRTLQQSLTDNTPSPDVMTPARFAAALDASYTALDGMPVTEGRRPGTTMTCLYLAENGAFVAHIGDSRVYQVRPGQGVIFHTSDHSLVNELVKAGELTPEQAAHHPRRNVITRAMQPGLPQPCQADTTLITDVRPGDYFFMCTDGILENVTDESLAAILSKDATDDAKLEELYTLCYARTRDNFTCILVPVKEVTGEPVATPVDMSAKAAAVANPGKEVKAAKAKAKTKAKPSAAKPRRSIVPLLLVILGVVAVGIAAYYIFPTDKKTAEEPDTSTPTDTVKDSGKTGHYTQAQDIPGQKANADNGLLPDNPGQTDPADENAKKPEDNQEPQIPEVPDLQLTNPNQTMQEQIVEQAPPVTKRQIRNKRKIRKTR